MTCHRCVVLAATAGLALLLGACGSETAGRADAPSTSASPAGPTAADLSSVGLASLLPTPKQMEYLLGYPLEVEVKEDLTQFHEGAEVEAQAAQVGFYRAAGDAAGGADRGGHVALSAFASASDAIRFLDTNPNYDDDREADPEEGFLEVFDLSEVSDAGTGWVYREDGEPPTLHTQGIARIGRVVVEVTLFHPEDATMIPQTRQVVDDLRARVPREESATASPAPV